MSYDSLKVEDLVRHKNITGPLDIIFGILISSTLHGPSSTLTWKVLTPKGFRYWTARSLELVE